MSIAYPPDREQSIQPELLAKVQTIGYRQTDGLAEIERIMADPSAILVDIRYSPKSQNLQWTKTAFSKKYKKRYVWIKALGNTKHHEPGNIQIADPEAGIQQLLDLLQNHSVLLLCGCEDYEKCHRKVVYELLKSALSVEDSKATCFSVESPEKQIVFTRTEEEYQMLAHMILDQEEQLTRLKGYDAEQREIIGRLTEKRAHTYHIISRLRQRDQQTRTQVQARYHCSIETLLNGPATMVPVTSFNQEQERRKTAEQDIIIVNKLESNPKIKPAQEKFIRHVINASKHGKYQDPEGRTRLNLKGIAERMGMSPSTAQRGIQFCEKQLPQLFDIASYTEPAPNGTDDTTRYYAKVKPEALQYLDTIEPIDFKQQGGNKYICALCGSKHVRIKKVTVRTLICDECHHESPPIDNEPVISYEYPNDSYTAKDAKERTPLHPNTVQNEAIIITSNPPSVCSENNIPAAAAMLLEIAGQHDTHIVMPRRPHLKKYLQVNRPLTLEDLINHLKGGEARGAICSYPNGQTRAFCWDADGIDDWIILKEAAAILAEHGYLPLLEESPADRGGHLWIISDAMVNATAGRTKIYSIYPELEKIREYWPALPEAKKEGNRVRLPGAFYSRTLPDQQEDAIKGWCKIVNMATENSSYNDQTHAALLLASMTPASVIVEDSIEPYTAIPEQQPAPQVKPSTLVIEEPMSERERQLGYRLPKVDEKWEADPKHGKIEKTTLYFAIMPEYAARWFNEKNSLEQIHPLEQNGMALSPNGAERSASTDYYTNAEGEERYTDFSTHGIRQDGTRDTGDALELAAKVQGISKSSLLYETTKQISAQARAELESAARSGQPLPVWLEEPVCIITPAGRRHYTKLLQEGKNGQRGNPDQLGAGNNNIPEGSRNGTRVSKPVRGENRATYQEEPTNKYNYTTQEAASRSKPDLNQSQQAIDKQGGISCRAIANEHQTRTNYRDTNGTDKAVEADHRNTTTVIEGAERSIATRPTAPTKHKIGICLVRDYQTNVPCGSTRWLPSREEEYVCSKCLTPIAATRRIEAEKAKGNLLA